MSIFIDLTEFFSAPHRTGIQRVCGELCRFWPGAISITPVGLLNGNSLVAMPRETLSVIRKYFEASSASLAPLERQLADLKAKTAASESIVALNGGGKVLVPEVFYDPARVAYFRNLSADKLRHFYFIIYDLLPFTNPEFFVADAPQEIINGYTRIVRAAHNVAFISGATRDAYYRRLLRKPCGNGPVLRLGSDGLGGRPVPPPSFDLTPKFTVLGTIEPRKNHALILEAFESLLPEIPGLQLVFLGAMGWVDTAFSEKVRKMAADTPGFSYDPSPSDEVICRHVRESRATIFISSAEGFGLPPVESLWLGTPAIVSAGIPSLEALGFDGIHVVERLDAVSVRKALLAFLQDSYAKRKSTEALALDLPTWQGFARETAEWIETT